MCTNVIGSKLKKYKRTIPSKIINREYEEALASVEHLAFISYQYNQYWTDEDLERYLIQIDAGLNPDNNSYEPIDNTILFYDGFGLDTRGLVQIEIRALGNLGYRIVYCAPQDAHDRIPILKAELKKYDAIIEFRKQVSYVDEYKDICAVIEKYRPQKAFLYTTPYDVSGVMAFNHYKGKIERYQVDLTDHAFWLGTGAFDYCFEGRDFGASLAFYKRNIPKEKLVILPPYPWEYWQEFKGYPFKKKDYQKIIFSGGSIYKTKDINRTFYQIVSSALERFPDVIFWYASNDTCDDMENLLIKYPDRAFHTQERSDLLAILNNIDVYLNTYPLTGGLMMQYSAMEGKPPLSLKFMDESQRFLPNQENLGIEFSDIDSLLNELEKLLNDNNYKTQRAAMIKNTVPTEIEFQTGMEQVLMHKPTKYSVNIHEVDTTEFCKVYFDEFIALGLEKNIGHPKLRL